MKRVLAPALLGLAALAAGQEFYEAQLRLGEAALSVGRALEATDALRIAAFGLLDRPPQLCQALANLALAEQAAGRPARADAALQRFVEVERGFPSCRDARLDPNRGSEFAALVKRRLPAPVAERILAPPARFPSPSATPPPSVAARPAPPGPAATPAASAPRPSASAPPAAAQVPASPAPTATPMASTRPPPASASPAAARADPAAASEELDRQPQLKATTRPVYPEAALRARLGGIVLLRVLVSEKGEPLRIEVARGVQPDLDQAAVTAVRQWLFEPGQKRGVAVNAWMTVAVPFEPARR